MIPGRSYGVSVPGFLFKPILGVAILRWNFAPAHYLPAWGSEELTCPRVGDSLTLGFIIATRKAKLMVFSGRKFFAGLILGSALLLTVAGCGGGGDAGGTRTAGGSSSAEGTKKLPGDLPSEIPVYDAKVYSVSDSDEGEWSFILETPDTKAEIAAGLNETFSNEGWEIQTELDLGDSGGQIQAENGQYNVRVVYTANPTTRDADSPTMMMSYDVRQAD